MMMAAGRHDLELVNETLGYRVTRVVQVPAGKVAPISSSCRRARQLERVALGRGVDRRPPRRRDADWQPVLPIGPHEVVFRIRSLARSATPSRSRCQRAGAAQRRHEVEDIGRGSLGLDARLLNVAMRHVHPSASLAAFVRRRHRGRAAEPLGAARDLYASARYDEALAMLNDLRPADAATRMSDMKSIEQYRSLCLLALGRGSEAEKAIAAVVTADPAYQPGESRRRRACAPRSPMSASGCCRRFASARYTVAKETFDRKDFASAESSFASCSHCSTTLTWAASCRICECSWPASWI